MWKVVLAHSAVARPGPSNRRQASTLIAPSSDGVRRHQTSLYKALRSLGTSPNFLMTIASPKPANPPFQAVLEPAPCSISSDRQSGHSHNERLWKVCLWREPRSNHCRHPFMTLGKFQGVWESKNVSESFNIVQFCSFRARSRRQPIRVR